MPSSLSPLKGDRPKWLLVVAIALFALIFFLGSGKSSPLAPRQGANPTYTVTAEIPVAIKLAGVVTGDRWQIKPVQKLTITPETPRWPFSIIPLLIPIIAFPFVEHSGLLGTDALALEGCIENDCNTADLGTLSLLGEEKLAVLKFEAVEPGDKLIVATLTENGVIRARESFRITVV